MTRAILRLLSRLLRALYRPRPRWFDGQVADTCHELDTCPNCAQPIEDGDAVRCRHGITWHERCARQMTAAGMWGGP